MRIVFFLLFITTLSFCQSDQRNQITFSAGYSRDIHAYCCQTDTAAGLGATYGYRFWPHLWAEVGVTAALQPLPEERGAYVDYKPDSRFIWVPFGVRGVLPLWHGRIELSAGGGGLYEKLSVSNPNENYGGAPRDGFGGYFSGGAAIAIDHRHRYWVGTSPRWFLANPSSGRHDRWFMITGDLSYRF